MLLDILSHCFCDTDAALNWFRSDLSDRTQSFSVVVGTSKPVNFTCSGPQAPVIGLLKFGANTEDIGKKIDTFMINDNVYADDTQLQSYKYSGLLKLKNLCRLLKTDVPPDAETRKIIWFGS